MPIAFRGLSTHTVNILRQTRRDAYDNPIERRLANGDGCCRHCLAPTPPDQDMLILAHRPFEGLNPYTETGPIFLCAEDCQAPKPEATIPTLLAAPQYLVRGYSSDERIVYGTGKVIPTPEIPAYAQQLLSDPAIAFVDVRSASNNCYQCRIRRA